MKYLLFVALSLFLMVSCTKAPGAESVSGASISADIRRIIEQNGVEDVVVCCIECDCDVSFDTHGGYSFEGSNFIRVNSISYNLNNLHSYDVQTVEESGSSGETKSILRLFFPL